MHRLRDSPLNYTVTLKLTFKVIDSGNIRYSTYDFIFVFYSKYASIYYPLYSEPLLEGGCQIYITTLAEEKLE